GHAGAALHVIEAAHAAERLAQHEERRPLTDDGHRRADRAVGRVVVQDPGPSHDHILNLLDRLSNPPACWVCGPNPEAPGTRPGWGRDPAGERGRRCRAARLLRPALSAHPGAEVLRP